MPPRRERHECKHLPATVYRGAVYLDWSTHKVATQQGPCRACGRYTVLTDCTGARCHKVCAEREATHELTAQRRTASRTAKTPQPRRPRSTTAGAARTRHLSAVPADPGRCA